ncbi:TetR/AcrR family transcriptional regulator [Mucilaginibacter sp. Mucisp84]|uniref:TetR/AcrR family transcriptional regulator n=1 Tax=Mucilaginibacter sp. Mucisp84 TaxID=3243058 RepID=UPI0039A5C253
MASKDRIQRLKDETRINILDASLRIAIEEGWQSLSMRKIADAIEYTPPVIYEYFNNKEAILLELTRRGYLILSKDIQAARNKHDLPASQLEAMWLAYWDFAFANQELYQLMFGVQINCCCGVVEELPESKSPLNQFREVILSLMNSANPSPDVICLKYYTFWSVVHGLISINILKRGYSDEMNNQVLKVAISDIINSIAKAT